MISGFTPRHNQYSFIANDNLYVGGGTTRLSQLDHETHADFYRLPLAGINGELSNHNIIKNIFPNPSDGNFYIDSKAGCRISIFNDQGKAVYSNTIHRGANLISLKNVLLPGCYYISCGYAYTRKVLILPD
jgi:hypothetical protein